MKMSSAIDRTRNHNLDWRDLFRGFLTLILHSIILVIAPNVLLAQTEFGPEQSSLTSKAPSLRFESLGLEEGLAQASGNFIMQDKNGFIWISTQGGVQRYDGYELELFSSIPFDTTSISENWVWAMSEANNGDIWLATEGGGLNRLDPTTGVAKHYRFDPDDSTSISSDRPFYPFEASNGDLWVSTLGDGLNRMRAGQEGIFSRFFHDHDDSTTISSNMLFWINEDKDGQIWVGSANGITRIDPETEAITRFLHDPALHRGYGAPENVGSSYFPPGDEGILWLATGRGLVRLESETGEHKRFLIEPDDGDFNPLNFLHEVRPDPRDPNVLWVAGPGTGVARFDMRTQQFTKYRHDPMDKNSLRDDNVQSLFLDRSGMMWAGTTSHGVNTFNPSAVNFTNIKHVANDPSSLAPGLVWGIYEDSQGSLWVGTDIGAGGHILTQFDAKTRKVTRHRHDPNDENTLRSGNLWAFAEDDRGGFWVAGQRGLSKLDRETGKVKRVWNATGAPIRNAIWGLTPVAEDPSSFWVASLGGIARFNTHTEEFTNIPISTDSTVNEPSVLTVMQDSKGTLWAGSTEGLYEVSPSGTATLVSSYNPRDTTTISDNTIYTILERKTEPGILWLALGNGGGLNRFDTETRTSTHITTEEGLASNQVYTVMEDNNGTLWMSTNSGISNYDPDTKSMRNYGLDDGLMALEYNQNAFARGNDGTLYFGSGLGVTAFAPELLRTNDTPPQVVISDVKLFNQSIQSDPDLSIRIPSSETQKITLNYDQNELSFDFVALHFSNARKNQYAYMLDGLDEDWVDAGTKRSASYTNLAPGNYTFMVKAANADGVWNERGVSLEIQVLPPWYQTWWAYVLLIGLLVGVVYAVDQIQRSRLTKKERERAVLREAELRAEAENKRRADTEELGKIGRAITSTLSVNKIIDTVYANVNAIMEAAIFGVGIYNKEKNCLDFPATKEEGKMLPPYAYPLDEEQWLAVWCFKNKKEIVISDYEKEIHHYVKKYSGPIEGKPPVSVIYMPLMQQDRVVGVITTQSFTKDAYTEYHVNLLRNLANYAAIALDNAAAYRKLDATLQDLRSTQQQLVQSEKMASLGELTAGIAHEIQNPLNFVNNFSDVNRELIEEIEEIRQKNGKQDLALEKEILQDIKDNLEKINHHGRRADAIVKGMLQHSRISTGKKEPTDINALADEYLRLAYHGLRAKDKSFNADFKTDFDEKLPPVMAVSQDVGRVLLNLINNAFHAVKERAKNESDQYKPQVTVTTSKSLAGKGVVITVADNGTGIPDHVKEKIFQPFFTTKSAGEGTGLGLSLSYDIITNGHDGEISVETLPSEGTKFIITLPVNS